MIVEGGGGAFSLLLEEDCVEVCDGEELRVCCEEGFV